MKKLLLFIVTIVVLAVAIWIIVKPHGTPVTTTPPPDQTSTTTPPVPTTPELSDVLQVPAADSSTWKSYSADPSFTISYPSDWAVNAKYQNTTEGPDRTFNGIAFTVPKTLVTGTNLGSDTSVSVEKNTYATNCNASEFFTADQGATADQQVMINGQQWTMSTAGDAGAGNRYEETIVSLPHAVTAADPCIGIRLFLHYGAIENYPASVKNFDRTAITGIYESMVNSFSQKQ